MEFFVFISTAIVTSILLYLIGTNSSEGMEKSPEELAKEEAESRARVIEKANNINITCPHCGSTHYMVIKRGLKAIRVCDNCLKKF